LEVRLRTVVRGERASRSIVNRTTAARFLGVVESLILAGSGYGAVFIYKDGHTTWTSEYPRLHYPEEPCRRCSIHNRPTCPFSAEDGA